MGKDVERPTLFICNVSSSVKPKTDYDGHSTRKNVVPYKEKPIKVNKGKVVKK